jgi:hypothetical protein
MMLIYKLNKQWDDHIIIRDKTDFIRIELQNMLNNNEIPVHLVKKVKVTIQYLAENNIFEFERSDCREKYGNELIDIMGIARERYWDWKENNKL